MDRGGPVTLPQPEVTTDVTVSLHCPVPSLASSVDESEIGFKLLIIVSEVHYDLNRELAISLMSVKSRICLPAPVVGN